MNGVDTLSSVLFKPVVDDWRISFWEAREESNKVGLGRAAKFIHDEFLTLHKLLKLIFMPFPRLHI